MEFLKTLIKTLLNVLYRIAYYISYVWFLIAFVLFYGIVGTWMNMGTSPKETDFYIGLYVCPFPIFLVAMVFLFHRRKVIQFCLAGVVLFLYFIVSVFTGIALESAPTSFAEDHPIPEGLAYNKPKAMHADLEEGVDPADSTTFLQLRNGGQGGIYEYSFFYPALPAGTIWLQCYEVSENLPLSESRIKKSSTQEIKGTNHFACFVNAREFTIFEGDWGDCYAARIEVWFKDRKGHERKLLEKTYGVEGWMR